MAIKNYTAYTATIKDFFKGVDAVSHHSTGHGGASCLSYNFDYSTGALLDGVGITRVSDVTGLCDIWTYKKIDAGEETVMASDSNGGVFFLRNGEAAKIHGTTLKGRVHFSNYHLHGEDVMLMFSDQSPLQLWDGVNMPIVIEDSPNIKSMDMFYDTMFMVDADGKTLRYTTDIDPTNWNNPLSEGGSLSMVDERGRIHRIVSFMGYLYVIRDYGITRISLNNGVAVSSGVYVSSGKIYPDTVSLCRDKIMFLSDDGLFVFDGLSAKRVLGRLSFIKPSLGANSMYAFGKYYLACRIDAEGKVGCENGAYTNNALIIYSPDDGSYSVSRGMDIAALTEANGDIYAIEGGYLSKLVSGATLNGQPLKKVWRGCLSDLNYAGEKSFKSVHIHADKDITLTMITDRETRVFSVKGSSQPSTVNTDMRGSTLSIIIECEQPSVTVFKPSITYFRL